MSLLDNRSKEFIEQSSIKPTTFQEIPAMAKDILDFIDFPKPDEEYTTSKGNIRTFAHAKGSTELVQIALFVAKKSGLMREGMDLPLRRVWYAFIKATLERGLEGYVYGKGKVIGDNRKPEDGDYTQSFSDIIKNTNLWYSDFGIKNPSATANIKTPNLFPPVLIGLEKRSYFDVLKNMADMLGFSIYSAGGQSKFAEQEDVAKKIKSNIFDITEGVDNLDIYVISDFDPAGIDIAINIGEHQKFYQERFGNTVNTMRLAPLPIHYTRPELTQGLYNVESKTRETWNFPSIKAQRVYPDNQEEIPRERGLEVESLPDQPLKEIMNNPPSDWDNRDYDDVNGNWKSLTRMRFILFDKLIEEYGMEQGLKVLLNKRVNPDSYWGESYDTNSLAEKFVEKGEGDDVETAISNAYYAVSSLETDVKEYISDYLSQDVSKVSKNIEEWFEWVIDKYVNPEHEEYDESVTDELKQNLINKMYYAISRNESNFIFKFPDKFSIDQVYDDNGELYPDDFEITIPEEIVENIKPLIEWADCIKLNTEEVQDYLKDIGNIEEEWEIPPVRPCKIIDDGEMVLVDLDEDFAPQDESFLMKELSKSVDILLKEKREWQSERESLEDKLDECKGDLTELVEAQEVIEAVQEEYKEVESIRREAAVEADIYKTKIEMLKEEIKDLTVKLEEKQVPVVPVILTPEKEELRIYSYWDKNQLNDTIFGDRMSKYHLKFTGARKIVSNIGKLVIKDAINTYEVYKKDLKEAETIIQKEALTDLVLSNLNRINDRLLKL